MTHAWRHVSSLTWFVKNSCRSSGCLTWRRGCSGRGGGAQTHLNPVLKRERESQPRGQSRTSNWSSWKADLHVGMEEEGLFNKWGRLTMHRKSWESGEPPVTESATSKTGDTFDETTFWSFFPLYSGFMPQKGKRTNCTSTLLSTHVGKTLCWQREEHRCISLNKTPGQQCCVCFLPLPPAQLTGGYTLSSFHCTHGTASYITVRSGSWLTSCDLWLQLLRAVCTVPACGWSEGPAASSLPTATLDFLLQSQGLARCKCRLKCIGGHLAAVSQLMVNVSWPWSVTAEKLHLWQEVVWGKTRLLAAESEQANAFH